MLVTYLPTGEAISTLHNVVGIGAGIQLASTICTSMEGKVVVGPVLSITYVYSVIEEMRAAPVNTLNPQRNAMAVADFLKAGNISGWLVAAYAAQMEKSPHELSASVMCDVMRK